MTSIEALHKQAIAHGTLQGVYFQEGFIDEDDLDENVNEFVLVNAATHLLNLEQRVDLRLKVLDAAAAVEEHGL